MRLLVAGGGTGGHVFPGIALAEEVVGRHPRNDVVFVGTAAVLGLFLATLPAESGGPRRSFGSCARLAASVALVLVALGCLGLPAWSVWRVHSAPARLEGYRREYRAAQASVRSRAATPSETGSWYRLELSVPVDGVAATSPG